MQTPITCGEATIRLLAKYGVHTVFGIPGVHTLDFCRGLDKGEVKHIRARNEQGAGFMAEGYARATGKPGVALVISGPGVTNATTALGQCYADSLPMLLLSAEPASNSIGKGWGVLHEVTEQKAVTAPLTALSATAYRAADVPELLAQAFTIFHSQRPRPVHISIPIDVQAEMVNEEWQAIMPPARPEPQQTLLEQAATLLKNAQRPVIMIGGGARKANHSLTRIAETLGAVVIASTAGKGIVPDDHPLSLSGGTVRPEVQAYLSTADCILAVGTELSETDSFVDLLDISGQIIRVDIDPRKMNDQYPATVAIIADAAPSMEKLYELLAGHDGSASQKPAQKKVQAIRAEIANNLTASEQQHTVLLELLRDACPEDTIYSGDACQVIYTGGFAMPMRQSGKWFYPAGYCALGCALPNAIGAKLALPDTPVIALAGDGGFMFTVQELMVAAELQLSLPIILWDNNGLKQIQDDMDSRNIEWVGVEGMNPDFVMLAEACGCAAVIPESSGEMRSALENAWMAEQPTLIIVREGADWLL